MIPQHHSACLGLSRRKVAPSAAAATPAAAAAAAAAAAVRGVALSKPSCLASSTSSDGSIRNSMLVLYPGCSQPSSIRRLAGVAQATTAAAEDAGPAAVEAASTATSGDSTLSELSVEDPTSFLDLGVDPLLLSGLAETGIEVPSPIQEAAIPVLLSGRNAAIQSYTGSGKTLAYLLPALTLGLRRAEAAYRRRQAALAAGKGKGGKAVLREDDMWTVQVVVIAPSQELAMQISRVAQSLFPQDSRTAVQQAIGGANLRRQAESIAEHQPIMVVGTPGRVVDLVGMGVLRLHRCPLLVLDEADQLLGDVYARHINTLMQHCGKRLGSGGSSSSGTGPAAAASAQQQPHQQDQSHHSEDSILQPTQRQTVLVSATLWEGGLSRFATWCPQPQFVTMGASPTWSDDFTDQHNGSAASDEPSKAWGWGAKGWEGPASVVAAGPKTQGSVGGPEGQGLVPTLPPQLEHMYIVALPDRKSDVLRRAVHALQINMALGFMNWQQRLKDMAAKVAAKKIEVGALHGELSASERGAIFDAARKGAYRLLLVSDLAARGLDMPQVDAVFNLELPSSASHYAHRAGRTGRMGAPGLVISLVAPGERFVVERLSKKLGVPIMECHLAGGELVVGPPPKKEKKKPREPEDLPADQTQPQQQQERGSDPAPGSSSKQQQPKGQQQQLSTPSAAAAAALAGSSTPSSTVTPADGITFDAEAAAFDPESVTSDMDDESGLFLLDEADDVEVEGDEPLEVYKARVQKELQAELEEIAQERKQRRQAKEAADAAAAGAEEGQERGRRPRRSKAAFAGPKGTPQEAAALAMAAIEADEAAKKARARLPAELLAGGTGGGSSRRSGRGGGRKLRGSTRKPSSAAR